MPKRFTAAHWPAAIVVFALLGVSALGAEPPAKTAPLKAAAILNRVTVFEFGQSKLADVLDWLRDKQGLRVHVDQPALSEAEVSLDTTVNIRVRRLPLKAALRLALEPLDLGFMQRGEVLIITTAAKAKESVYPVVYPIGDLLTKGVPGNPDAYDYEWLTDLVTGSLGRTTWERSGGPGSLATFDTSLVVSQTGAMHEEIARLFAELRRAKLARPGARPGPLPMAGPWEKTFTLKFDKVPLETALDRISEAAGVDILLDRAQIGEHPLLASAGPGAEADDDTLISAELEKTNLRQALREVLFPHDLSHVERHGAVLITRHDKAEESCRLQVYDVKALLKERDAKPETLGDLDFYAFATLLMSSVNPSSWDEAGGPATVNEYDGFLVVLQTDDAHDQIASLFEQLRQVKFHGVPGGPPPLDADLRKALAANTTCDFADKTLEEVLDFYAEKHDIEISLDRPALARGGISPNAKINLKLGELKLHAALEFVLDPLELRYYLVNDTLVVSTADVADKHPSPRVYDLADFAAAAKKPKTAALEISMLIQKTTEPTSWDEAGGHGTVVVFENTLVVSNSHSVHCEIEDLLAELRRLRPKTPPR